MHSDFSSTKCSGMMFSSPEPFLFCCHSVRLDVRHVLLLSTASWVLHINLGEIELGKIDLDGVHAWS